MRHRWLQAVVAVAVLAGGLGPVAAAGAATAARPSVLRLLAQSTTVEPEGRFEMTVALDTPAPPDAQLHVAVHTRLMSRSLFEEALGDQRGGVVGSFSFPLADLQAGSSANAVPLALPLTLASRAPAGQLRILRDGVYPVRVELRSAEDDVLAGFTTFLVRLAPAPREAPPLQVALVVPFGSPPSLQPDGSVRVSPPELTRLGGIARALAAQPGLPATVVPTPETVAALAQSQAGAGVLAQLDDALPGRQVLATPYVDIDLGAMLAAGLGDELDLQFTQGAAALQGGLGTARPDGRTWLATEPLTAQAVRFLRSRNVDQLVAVDSALSPLELETTLLNPTEVHADPAPPTRTAVVDATLSERLAAPGADPVLAAHQLLAELAQLFHDRPGLVRGVVLAAPADWNPPAPFVDTLTAGLVTHPLLRAVTLDQWFAGVPTLRDEAGGAVTRSLAPASPTSVAGLAASLRQVRPRLAGFSSMLATASPLPASLSRRLLVASAATFDSGQRGTYTDVVSRAINDQLAGIETPRRERITLASRNGTLPIWLVSHLTYPVTVVVRLESDKLDFPDAQEQVVTLNEGRTKVDFEVRARASGTFPMDITTSSPDGQLVIGQARSSVRSTAVSGVGAVLTVGALLFLAAWWLKHLRTTRLNRRLIGAGGAPEPPDDPGALPDAPAPS